MKDIACLTCESTRYATYSLSLKKAAFVTRRVHVDLFELTCGVDEGYYSFKRNDTPNNQRCLHSKSRHDRVIFSIRHLVGPPRKSVF